MHDLDPLTAGALDRLSLAALASAILWLVLVWALAW
jgi:hypothetical protein